MTEIPPDMRRTHYFREWRKYRGLTQTQAGERMGIDQGNLSKIENSKIRWDEDFLYAAAYAYSCEPSDLFKVNPLKEGKVVDLMDKLREASPEEQEHLRRFVDGYLKSAN